MVSSVDASYEISAEPHEGTEGRRAQRNGYCPRILRTRAGELELEVPRTRDGEFYPFLLERCQRSEEALIAALAECYVQGGVRPGEWPGSARSCAAAE